MVYTHRVAFRFPDGHIQLWPKYIDPKRLRFTGIQDAVAYARREAKDATGPLEADVIEQPSRTRLRCLSDGRGGVREIPMV
jgi:hypothetical protein